MGARLPGSDPWKYQDLRPHPFMLRLVQWQRLIEGRPGPWTKYHLVSDTARQLEAGELAAEKWLVMECGLQVPDEQVEYEWEALALPPVSEWDELCAICRHQSWVKRRQLMNEAAESATTWDYRDV